MWLPRSPRAALFFSMCVLCVAAQETGRRTPVRGVDLSICFGFVLMAGGLIQVEVPSHVDVGCARRCGSTKRSASRACLLLRKRARDPAKRQARLPLTPLPLPPEGVRVMSTNSMIDCLELEGQDRRGWDRKRERGRESTHARMRKKTASTRKDTEASPPSFATHPQLVARSTPDLRQVGTRRKGGQQRERGLLLSLSLQSSSADHTHACRLLGPTHPCDRSLLLKCMTTMTYECPETPQV